SVYGPPRARSLERLDDSDRDRGRQSQSAVAYAPHGLPHPRSADRHPGRRKARRADPRRAAVPTPVAPGTRRHSGAHGAGGGGSRSFIRRALTMNSSLNSRVGRLTARPLAGAILSAALFLGTRDLSSQMPPSPL